MNITPFPSQQPSSFPFKIGDFEFHWYGIFFALGIMFAIFFIVSKLRFFYRVEDTPFYIFIFIAIPCMIIGARAWSFIIGDSQAGTTPFFDFANGIAGLAIQGAIVLCTLVGVVWFGFVLRAPRYFAATSNEVVRDGKITEETVHRKISLWVIADAILPAILIGQAIGRWGNFFNHEVYGGIVQTAQLGADGQYFADASGAAFTQWGFLRGFMPDVWNNMWIQTGSVVAFRTPIFLIESFCNVCCFLFIYYGAEHIRGYRAGTCAFAYFFATGLIRLIIETFRDAAFRFQTSIVLSALFLAAGAIGVACCYLVFVPLRKYRCWYYVGTKAWFHSVAAITYLSAAIKAKTRNGPKPVYANAYLAMDRKRKHSYERNFWDQFYYNDNVPVPPHRAD